MRVLLIEDDVETQTYVTAGLNVRGHEVEVEATGDGGLARALGGGFDIVVIDRMLPGIDGLTAVRTLRAGGHRIPVLMLTALGLVEDRVEGLEGGADDYLVKPFELPELAARIAALARRGEAETQTRLVLLDLVLDRLARTVSRGGDPVDLQHREFQLLELLLLETPRVVTRSMLLEKIWRFNFDPGTNLVESHISRLRSKIDRGGDRPLIHTVRGEGYAAFVG